MTDLARYLIPGTDEAFYIPDFVTAEEEDFIIRKIHESPLPKWKHLANRRLQIWGGSMTAKGVLIPEEVPPFINKYPDIIARIKATGAFQSSPHGAPNHIIMNEYLPGQGIMPHEDGPAYHPVVATLSLGSHAVFHYYRYKPSTTADSASNQGRAIDPDPVFSVFLEPRSLVITRASLYQTHLHGIDGVHADVFPAPSDTASGSSARIANVELLGDAPTRELVANGGTLERRARYSLTCRDVARVATGLPGLKR
ncbi:uncharacterized protein C8Q71DRAFT_754299 [Rhodofomes roseus]|uniref:Fe2OG dioxygenase domain-containing protein n=1 Tax=Rhodofomes roseus TaxID=34475 RepID=A0ABQ8KIY8_9APHY|nr:uncharacterized protein C8Q71DRAFT_754299 [Rhodofomes roseus]KAH9837750.1 hypothetical protein C8Q71DRAFT_754299 [Rhodofomes roseus]